MTNNLIGKGGISTNIAEININDNVYSDPKHIAEHLNDYFVNVGPNFASQSKGSSDFDEVRCNPTDVNSSLYFRTIAEADIIKSIQNLKVSKSTGLDGIPAKLLKLCCNIIAPSLTYILISQSQLVFLLTIGEKPG